MSLMGQKCQQVDEDIIDLINSDKSKTVADIDDVIAEMHGEMFRGRVEELLNDMYIG